MAHSDLPRIIIGFGHKRQRGKDTAAAFAHSRLLQWHLCARLDSFAYSIKEGIGRRVFGFSAAQLYGNLKGELDLFWGLTPRDVFQRFGTEVVREQFGADIWVKTLRRRAMEDMYTSVVVTDVRFRNEFQALREMGAWLIRVDRDVPYVEGIDDHQSEIDLDGWHGWDMILINDGTPADLEEDIKVLVDTILEREGLVPADDEEFSE